MKRRLHLISLVLLAVSLIYDIVVWGALPLLPGVGAAIAESARREAPIAATYIAIGSPLDAAMSPLQDFGQRRLTAAFGEGFERIQADNTVAMDLIFNTTWNGQHRWIKFMYWAPVVLILLSVSLWSRRPRQVRMIGRRR